MKKILLFNLLCVFFLGSVFNAKAVTITWTGCKSNDWHLANNWNPKQVPTYLDAVIIPTVATYPHITGIACCASVDITSAAVNALTIENSPTGILHIGNSAPVPLVKKFVFVVTNVESSTTSPATRDTRCNTAAAASLCGGTYKAWVSNAAGTGNNVPSTTNVQYVLPNGTKVADNWADLTDGTLDNAINQFANGSNASGYDVWTGLSSNGTVNANTCGNWGDQTQNGRSGLTSSATSTWTSNSTDPCESAVYTTVGYYVSGQDAACANCFPGSFAVWTSNSCGSGKDAACADIPVAFCCCGSCREITGYVTEDKRHYCFQQ